MNSKETKPDLPTIRRDKYFATVVLNEKFKDAYQFIYASQLYGTFFSIYAKFNVKKRDKDVQLKNIVFRIINYKGLINIGILDVQHDYVIKKKVKLRFLISLKGLINPLHDLKYECTEKDIFLKTGDKIIIRRKLERLIDCPEVSIIKFDDCPTASISSGVFDEEFYYRDGLFAIDAQKSKLEHQIDKNFPESEDEEIINPGSRCPKGLVKIITCE